VAINTGTVNERVKPIRSEGPRSFEAKITNWQDGMIMIREVSRQTAREEIEDENRYLSGGM